MVAPSLFIVAGPNGSGKSLLSRSLTQSDYEVFDGDKHMTELALKFSETGSEALWSYIDHDIFGSQKQQAIRLKRNYAFETNFSSVNPMSSADEFREAGYDVHLIFLGLNSIAESILRVAYRVKNGGHKVTEESIRYNFEHGYKNLYAHFNKFTSVTVFNNSVASGVGTIVPVEVLVITDGLLHLQSRDYPDWVNPLIEGFDPENIRYPSGDL